MPSYKLILAYDGTDYLGWQRQPHGVTIQGILEKTFQDIFHHKASIVGASRTDTGVHAYGQVACVRTQIDLDAKTIHKAWRNILPSTIMIHDIERVDDTYSPHRSVKQKTYHYTFFTAQPSPFTMRYGWHYKLPVDMIKLHDALQIFVGTHDFRSFCTGHGRENTTRHIDEITIEDINAFTYRISVKGPGFLHHMIRRIVGACLQVASHDKLTLHDLHQALAARHPAQKFFTAPPQGLMLYRIMYDSV